MYSHQEIISDREQLLFSTPVKSLKIQEDWLSVYEKSLKKSFKPSLSISSPLPKTFEFQRPEFISKKQSVSEPVPVESPAKETSFSNKSATSRQNEYDTRTEHRKRYELMSKLDLLKDMTDIQLPIFDENTHIDDLEQMYTHYSRTLFIEKSVRNHKLYLIIMFILLEYGAEYSNVPAKGISQFLINNMSTLENWLILYAEKTYVPDSEELDINIINPLYCLARELLKQVISFVGVLVLGNKFNLPSDTSSTILKAITTLFCESKYEYLYRLLTSSNNEGEQIVKTGDHEYQEVIVSLKGLWDQYSPMLTNGGLGSLLSMFGIGGGGGGSAPEEEKVEAPKAARPRAKRRQ